MKSWRERISEARVRGAFTERDMTDACLDWGTCAIGEMRERFGEEVVRVSGFAGGPLDAQLRRLGGEMAAPGFAAAVRLGHIDEAERLLDAIEDRALQLKREAGR